MVTDLYISPTQFAGHYLYTYFRVRVLHPQQILGQFFAEALMNFTDTLACHRARFQPPPSIHLWTVTCAFASSCRSPLRGSLL